MFVRKKKNRSGSVSIVVVDKSRGRFREVRQFGVAHTEAEADALYTQAREWICRYAGQQTIDFGGGAVASENEVDMLVSRIDGVSINGTQLLLNRVHNRVGSAVQFKEHGAHNDRGMRVQDGFCFTQTAIEGEESEDGIHEHDRVDAMLILYTTFMNEADMSDTQRTAINKEHFETWKRCVEYLQNMYGKANSGIL